MLIRKIILGCVIVLFADVSHGFRQKKRTKIDKTGKYPWRFIMAKYNCYLRRICTETGVRACGWDEIEGYLAYFKDNCAMFQVNCNNAGKSSYVIQDNMVCEEKSKYLNKTIVSAKLPTKPTTVETKRTREWWWQGSTTNPYKYLQDTLDWVDK